MSNCDCDDIFVYAYKFVLCCDNLLVWSLTGTHICTHFGYICTHICNWQNGKGCEWCDVWDYDWVISVYEFVWWMWVFFKFDVSDWLIWMIVVTVIVTGTHIHTHLCTCVHCGYPYTYICTWQTEQYVSIVWLRLRLYFMREHESLWFDIVNLMVWLTDAPTDWIVYLFWWFWN